MKGCDMVTALAHMLGTGGPLCRGRKGDLWDQRDHWRQAQDRSRSPPSLLLSLKPGAAPTWGGSAAFPGNLPPAVGTTGTGSPLQSRREASRERQ